MTLPLFTLDKFPPENKFINIKNLMADPLLDS